ncbi:hypothetical protein HYX16_05320 [Candidatus Woesearchaeota archaeon]|nr:hypothetical protein [Candidatus Woesearchaeota archaeon]
MKKSFVIFVVLVIFLLVISGCDSLPNISNVPSLPSLGQKEKTITQSSALSIKFLEGQPPSDEIYAGQDFRVALELTNNAPQEISGIIELSDTPSDAFSSLSGIEQSSFSLQPAEESGERLVPTKEIIKFGPYRYYTDIYFKGMTTTFITEVKTEHKESITTQLCVKSAETEGIKCPNKETITNFGAKANLAPVKVTKVEKTLIPDESGTATLNLKVYLSNSGKGKIDNSDETLNNLNINLQGSNLACSGINKVSLKIGERTITCTAQVSISEELFRQDILEISYSYPYKIIETLGPIKVTKFEA